MKALTVSEVKARFSELLSRVKNGEKIKILYGKSKKPIAMLVPLENKGIPRKIGIFNGKLFLRKRKTIKSLRKISFKNKILRTFSAFYYVKCQELADN